MQARYRSVSKLKVKKNMIMIGVHEDLQNSQDGDGDWT